MAFIERWLTRERLAPIITGVVILAIWQIGVSAALPDFVARPSGILLAIPSTIASEESHIIARAMTRGGRASSGRPAAASQPGHSSPR